MWTQAWLFPLFFGELNCADTLNKAAVEMSMALLAGQLKKVRSGIRAYKFWAIGIQGHLPSHSMQVGAHCIVIVCGSTCSRGLYARWW